MRSLANKVARPWMLLLLTCGTGMLIGVAGNLVYAQAWQHDPGASAELARRGPKHCDGACYNLTINPKLTKNDIQVVIIKSDGTCTNQMIIDKVTDYFVGLGDGNAHTQSCGDSRCSCTADVTLNANGGTVTETLPDINVGAGAKIPFGPNCIVTVKVTITYKGGNGTFGHCT
jgi:hypothetical protein